MHPDYEGVGLSGKLVSSRNAFCEANKVAWLQVLITNERIKKMFSKMDFKVVGQAEVNYHGLTQPRLVDMFMKECKYA